MLWLGACCTQEIKDKLLPLDVAQRAPGQHLALHGWANRYSLHPRCMRQCPASGVPEVSRSQDHPPAKLPQEDGAARGGGKHLQKTRPPVPCDPPRNISISVYFQQVGRYEPTPHAFYSTLCLGHPLFCLFSGPSFSSQLCEHDLPQLQIDVPRDGLSTSTQNQQESSAEKSEFSMEGGRLFPPYIARVFAALSLDAQSLLRRGSY